MHPANEKMAEKQDWPLWVGRLAYWQGKNWQTEGILLSQSLSPLQNAG
jgi:hypothetical protein